MNRWLRPLAPLLFLLAACQGDGPSRPAATAAPTTAEDSVARFATGPACTLDRSTGLSWERDAADATRLPQTDDARDCPSGACSVAAHLRRAQQQRLCGHDDWRVPNERELRTLLQPELASGGKAAIDHEAFPYARPGPYWSSRSWRAEGIVAVWFDGEHASLPTAALSRRDTAFVRLVRGTPLKDAPAIASRLGPPYIRLDAAGRPISEDATAWECVDDARLPDLLRHSTLWLAPSTAAASPNHPHGHAAVQTLIDTARRQQRCNTAAWRLPTAAELARLQQIATAAAEAAGAKAPATPEVRQFPSAFPHFAADQAYWIAGNNGEVLQQGQPRPAEAGERARVLLIATTDRPPMPVRPTPDETLPTQAELDALRERYLRYRPGQAQQPDWPAPTVDASVADGFSDLGLLPPPPFPPDNPYSEAKVALGQALFFDKRLSHGGSLACAGCHDPATGWTDHRPLSPGDAGQLGERNAMTILNTAYATSLFWDGRAATLEEQARGPIANPFEMHQPLDHAAAAIAAAPEYPPLFAAAFGDARIDIQRIAQALATFERTIVSRESAFDRFLKGERHALSDDALWGLHLFRTKARCINCHNGPLFSDNRFHSNGLHYYGRELEDLGRYTVTGRAADIGRFRTPSLRDVMHTGNYMHNGAFPLTENQGVIAMYDAGMVQTPPVGLAKYDPDYPRTSPEIRPLGLSAAEKKALFAFLQSISAPPRQGPASAAEIGQGGEAAR